MRWETGLLFAMVPLPLADGGAGFVADETVGAANIKAFGNQPLLHLAHRAAGEGLKFAPFYLERFVYGHAVGEVADEQGVDIGFVIFFKYIEIGCGDIGRAITPGGEKQEPPA